MGAGFEIRDSGFVKAEARGLVSHASLYESRLPTAERLVIPNPESQGFNP